MTLTSAGEGREAAEAALAETIATTWNFADPRASEARFSELAERLLASGDPAGSWQALTQVARARGLDRRFSEGHQALDSFAALLKEAPPAVRVRVLLERGRLYNSSGEPERARPLFEQAWELGKAAGLDALAVDAAHMVALTYLSSPEQAIKWNDIALAYARASAQPRARLWLGSLLNNQGWSYFDRGDYARALALFEEAYEERVQRDGSGARSPATRIAAWAVARVLRAMGQLEQALARQTELEREWQAAGSESGFVLEEIGECQLALGAPQRAAPYFSRAHALLSQDAQFAANNVARLQRLAQLGAER
jgi:tetratricopeptide (TPR) repeat protein